MNFGAIRSNNYPVCFLVPQFLFVDLVVLHQYWLLAVRPLVLLDDGLLLQKQSTSWEFVCPFKRWNYLCPRIVVRGALRKFTAFVSLSSKLLHLVCLRLLWDSPLFLLIFLLV